MSQEHICWPRVFSHTMQRSDGWISNCGPRILRAMGRGPLEGGGVHRGREISFPFSQSSLGLIHFIYFMCT